MKKITVVGAGRVGEATAQIIAEREMAREVLLLDVREGVPQGMALDIAQTALPFQFDTQVSGENDPEAMAESDLVIVTAGIPRKAGVSRESLLQTNLRVVDNVIEQIVEYAPQAMVMMVTNPVDIFTFHVWNRTGWDRSRIVGMAGVLDAARMASFIVRETGFSVKDIRTMVLGCHGDSMIPMPRFSTVSGIPIEHFLDQEAIARVVERTRQGGAEILALRRTSSAYDAPAAAIAQMVDAIANNRKSLLPCVAILEGEYGQRDTAMGVPCLLDAAGMQSIIELPLTEAERLIFNRAAERMEIDITQLPN